MTFAPDESCPRFFFDHRAVPDSRPTRGVAKVYFGVTAAPMPDCCNAELRRCRPEPVKDAVS
jgi:hypothetical protein